MSRSFGSISEESEPKAKVTQLTPKVVFRKKPTLHVFDASNWLCRAYFVSQNQNRKLTAPDGTPTGAVYIFMTMVDAMLSQIRRDPKGAYAAFCFDGRSNSTWRYRAIRNWSAEQTKDTITKVFPKSSDYKGNRDRTKTADLPIQMDLAQEILEAYGVWARRKTPYEADDIIGTLSHRFSRKYFVDIYSRDKDTLQLVDNPRTQVIMAAQSNAIEKRYTLKNVHSHFGVTHDLIVDFLAMCGDTADNVPGLPGVAEGTAIKLLEEYGSLANLIKAAPTIKSNARWRNAIIGKYPLMDLDLQRELVTIDRNVPMLPKNISDFEIREPDLKAIKDLKKRLKFKRIFEI